jgi:hypothetical protein
MLVLALEFSRIRAARLDRAGVDCPPTRGSQRGERWPDSHVAGRRQSRSLKTEERGPDLHRGSRGVQAGDGFDAAGGLVVVTIWCEPISQCSTG